jgi:hypothetical protein
MRWIVVPLALLLTAGAAAGQAAPGAERELGAAVAAARQAAQESAGARSRAGVSALPLAFKANEDCVPQLVLCGQFVQSELTERDCALDDGGFGDLWFFPSYHRQAVAAAAQSDDFAMLLGLATPDLQAVDAAVLPVGEVGSVSAFATRPGNWLVAILSDTSSVKKTGRYSFLVGCDLKCVADAATLCLGKGRYRVQVAWENQFSGDLGFGRAIKRTDAAGFFSFGDPGNVELLVKVLNFGDAIKVFYGELTNLHFTIAVTDMVTDKTKIYTNTERDCGGIDNNAFPSTAAPAAETAAGEEKTRGGSCRADRDTLCLMDGRFAVEVAWANPGNGTSGRGGAVPISKATGSFYFSDKGNIELVAKLLDFGDRIAFFYGTLSNLEYTLTVTDTRTGAAKSYHNPGGTFCGGLDNSAF